VLDPLNNLNTPCALALFLGSMDKTAKRLTRVRSYPYRLQFPVARYLSPGQNVKRDHFLRLRSPYQAFGRSPVRSGNFKTYGARPHASAWRGVSGSPSDGR
jgi:hypothetical protein